MWIIKARFAVCLLAAFIASAKAVDQDLTVYAQALSRTEGPPLHSTEEAVVDVTKARSRQRWLSSVSLDVMKRVMLIVLFAFGAICLALLVLSYHDARVGANKVFHGSGPVTVSFVSIHPSRAHGIWIFWRMHFARKTREKEMAPGDVALWYLRPFRHVEFTKDM